MLLALIAIAWLAVAALCVVVCVMAQRGDSEPAASASRTCADGDMSATGEGLVVWDSLPELSVQAQDARLTAHGAR
jgi:hypothetical protein